MPNLRLLTLTENCHRVVSATVATLSRYSALPCPALLGTSQPLCAEIKALSHPILSYIEDVDVLTGLGHTVRHETARDGK